MILLRFGEFFVRIFEPPACVYVRREGNLVLSSAPLMELKSHPSSCGWRDLLLISLRRANAPPTYYAGRSLNPTP